MELIEVLALRDFALQFLSGDKQADLKRKGRRYSGNKNIAMNITVLYMQRLIVDPGSAIETAAIDALYRTTLHPKIYWYDRDPAEFGQTPEQVQEHWIANARDLVDRIFMLARLAEVEPPQWLQALAGGSDATDNPASDWRQRIRDEATRWCMERKADGKKEPTKKAIAAEMAVWCRNNDVMTDTGVNPNAEYVRRHVLNRWNHP